VPLDRRGRVHGLAFVLGFSLLGFLTTIG